MNIRINTSFKFRIEGINYSSNGEICITLSSDELPQQEGCHYSTVVNSGDCVLLLTKNVPIYTVQRLMCHSDIGMTKIYADLLNRSKSKALKRLPTLGVVF